MHGDDASFRHGKHGEHSHWRRRVATPVRLRHRGAGPPGCVVVRRITDDLGRGWRVRELASGPGVTLLFQSDIRGVRSEIRSSREPLESLGDEDVLAVLLPIEP